MNLLATIRLQGQASAQRLLRKLWPIRSWRRESCREGGAGAALPQVMRTRLAASAQVASVALPTITRSAMAHKRKFDAALGSVSAKQLTAVSLFCGAGGMDVGFNRAAFKTIWAADKNSAACATYNRYAQREIALRRDLAKEDFKELRQQLACTPDCVFGGPPCQGFSQAGKMSQTDARNDLINVFLGAVEKLRPRCFVMENVKNLNNRCRFRPLLDALVQRAEKLGYSCATEVVNCNDFDVPQARERLIFVGFLPGGRLRHPSKYFFRVLRRYSKRAQASGEVLRTLGRAGSETNPLGSTAKIVVTKNPVLRQSPYAGMLFNGKGRPIDPSRPSPTLTASMGGNQTPIIDEKQFFDGEEGWVARLHRDLKDQQHKGHKKERPSVPGYLRRLTVAEAARLHTFPPNYPFGKAAYKQIGNAVPCNFAFALASAAKETLDADAAPA